MKEEIEKRKYNRFIVLNELYKEGAGSTTKKVNITKIAISVGIKNGIFDEVIDYLTSEKLVHATVNPGSYTGSITHKGKKAIEWTNCFPDEASEYFPPLNEMIS